MPPLSLELALFAGLSLAIHAITALAAWWRCRLRRTLQSPIRNAPAVSIVRPVHGLTEIEATTLASSFALDYPHYEVIFCAERETDQAVPYLRRLIADHPKIRAKVLVGTTVRSVNPKLDNIEKGWNEAAHDWIIMADANVLMPTDYIQRLLAGWRPDAGVVSAPPIGCAPGTFCRHRPEGSRKFRALCLEFISLV